MRVSDSGPTRTINVKAHTRTIKAPPPKTDAQTSGKNYGLAKANKFAATPKTDAQTSGKGYGLPKAKAYTRSIHSAPLHYSPEVQALSDVGNIARKGGQYGLDTAANILARLHGSGGGNLATISHPGTSSELTNILQAGLHHPGAVAGHTLTGLRDMAAAIPAGTIALLHDPTAFPGMVAKDLAARYGGTETDAQQQARYTDKGIAPEILDAATLATGAGSVLSRAFVKPAQAGKFGEGLARLGAARPLLRTSGGVAKEQPLADRLLRIAAQRKLDKLRAAKDTRAVARATDPATNEVAASHRLAAGLSGGKEVAPLFDSAAAKAVRHKIALGRNVTRNLMKNEQHFHVDRFARGALGKLNKHERKAFYYDATGIIPNRGNVAETRAALVARREGIVARRLESGDKAPRGKLDELRTLDHLIANTHEAFTPQLSQTIHDLTPQDLHVGRQDPGLTAGQRLTRRYAQQAETLGLERGHVPASVPPQPSHVLDFSPHSRPFKTHTGTHFESGRGVVLGDGRLVTAFDTESTHTGLRLAHGGDRAELLNARLPGDEIMIRPDGTFVIHARRNSPSAPFQSDAALARHIEQADPRLKWEHDSTPGQHPDDMVPPPVPGMVHGQESIPDYVARIKEAAQGAGLRDRPLYFPSEKYLAEDHASRALGGTKATREDFRYTGKLFREGRQNIHPDVYLTGLARSIKRKHNWKLIADQYDAHTIPGLQHMSMSQAKHQILVRGIDPKTVNFWHPGRFRAALHDAQDGDNQMLNAEDPMRYGDTVSGDEEAHIERLQAAHADATKTPDLNSEQYVKDRGWSVVPKSAHDEIHSSIQAAGQAHVERILTNAFKTKPSRYLLGANPLWNAFQIGSNVMLGVGATGLKHGGLPVDLLRGFRLYRSLDPKTQHLVDAYIGEGAGAHGNVTRLGSTAGKVASPYRKFLNLPAFDKRLRIAGHGVSPTLRELNPIEAGFRLDRFQNARFRRALLFHSMKEFGHKLTPEKVHEIMSSPAAAEDHAKFVSDWLGDYSTYTSRERHFQAVPITPLFYGYIRHSLNLMFRTLPRDNPLLLETLGHIGQMQRNQQVKLGVDKLPWAAGKFYWAGSDGKTHEFDTTRANPALNVLTGLHSVSQLAGATSPLLSEAIDQVTHRNNYADREWSVNGVPAAFGAKSADYSLGDRLGIATAQTLGLSNIYRVLARHTLFGPQSDNALPWSPIPIQHKSPAGQARDAQWAAQDRADAHEWIHELLPWGRVSQDPQIQAAREALKTKAAPKVKSFGGGSSAKPFGTSGSTKPFGAGN